MEFFKRDEEEDKNIVEEYLDGFARAHCISDFIVRKEPLAHAISMMYRLAFPEGSVVNPSPFKKAGAFTTAICVHRPFETFLPSGPYGDLCTHQNSIIACRFCLDALRGASIECNRRKKIISFSDPLKVSDHFFKEMILSFSKATESSYPVISLLYESLVYQTNPEVQYSEIAFET